MEEIPVSVSRKALAVVGGVSAALLLAMLSQLALNSLMPIQGRTGWGSRDLYGVLQYLVLYGLSWVISAQLGSYIISAVVKKQGMFYGLINGLILFWFFIAHFSLVILPLIDQYYPATGSLLDQAARVYAPILIGLGIVCDGMLMGFAQETGRKRALERKAMASDGGEGSPPRHQEWINCPECQAVNSDANAFCNICAAPLGAWRARPAALKTTGQYPKEAQEDGLHWQVALAIALLIVGALSMALVVWGLTSMPKRPAPAKIESTISKPLSPESKKWIPAAGAVLAKMNKDDPATMETKIPRYVVKRLLNEWWDIDDHDSAVKTIQWLTEEGHTKTFQALYSEIKGMDDVAFAAKRQSILKDHGSRGAKRADILRLNASTIEEKGLAAWDHGRVIFVSRMSLAAGYISESEAWSASANSARILQKTYDSWADFSENYLMGRSLWGPEDNPAPAELSVDWLLSNQSSPWRTIPWDTPLE
ncbi:MAG: DUF1266 domain-containing protein [Candidatus Aquicultorales bacterium]